MYANAEQLRCWVGCTGAMGGVRAPLPTGPSGGGAGPSPAPAHHLRARPRRAAISVRAHSAVLAHGPRATPGVRGGGGAPARAERRRRQRGESAACPLLSSPLRRSLEALRHELRNALHSACPPPGCSRVSGHAITPCWVCEARSGRALRRHQLHGSFTLSLIAGRSCRLYVSGASLHSTRSRLTSKQWCVCR